MTKEIEAAMESEIKQLPWMGEETKQRALEKLHGIVNKIGYPDKWRDYSSIKIARDDYFGNVERATVFESRRELAKIGKPVDRTEWGMTPPTVNAYLRSADERHQLPGRRAAAAAVRSEDGRRAQLRQHRRHHRSRADARFRRRRPPVRRQGRSEGLVDQERRRRVREARQLRVRSILRSTP